MPIVKLVRDYQRKRVEVWFWDKADYKRWQTFPKTDGRTDTIGKVCWSIFGMYMPIAPTSTLRFGVDEKTTHFSYKKGVKI